MNPFQYCPTCGALEWIERRDRVDSRVVAYLLTCGHWFGMVEWENAHRPG